MKRWTLANMVTYASLFFGLSAVAAGLEAQFSLAGILLIGSVVLDFLDGRIARMQKTTSDFGMYLDSLSDLVAFGVAPAILAMLIGPRSSFLLLLAFFFVASGAFRLARFQSTPVRGGFQGVPITVNGLFVGLGLIFFSVSSLQLLFPWYFFVMALLMAGSFKVKKI